MTAPVKIHLCISRDVVLSSNVNLHWTERAKRVKVIRDMGIVMGRTVRTKLHQATCEVEVTWPDKRRRDAANLYPTCKAAIDGFIDAELLLDDSDRYMKALTIKAAERTLRTPGVAAYLTFTFTPVQPANNGGDA